LVATALHYLEHLVDFWKEAGNFVAGNQMLLARMVRPHFWAIEIVGPPSVARTWRARRDAQ
jgi:hypothetical protein